MRKIFTLCLLFSVILGAQAQRNLSMRSAVLDSLSCGLNSSKPVTVIVKNTGSVEITDATISYTVAPGQATAISQAFPAILPNDSVKFTFTTGFIPTAAGVYKYSVIVNVPNSTVLTDDTLRYIHSYSDLTINTFPIFNSFETTDEGFYPYIASGNTAITRNRPNGTFINRAPAGTASWNSTTNGQTNYLPNSVLYLYSSCYDFTGVAIPKISFNISYNTETSVDGIQLQSSTNGGSTWNTVGATGGTWYSSSRVTSLQQFVRTGAGGVITAAGWSGNNVGGAGRSLNALVSAPTLAGKNKVVFRFVFASNANSNVGNGFAIDQFKVFDTELPNLRVLGLLNLQASGCNASDTTKVILRITNIGATTSGIRASYFYDSTAVFSQDVPYTLRKNDTVDFEFSQRINTLAGPDTIRAWVSSPYDVVYNNDTTPTSIFNLRRSINNFPYFEGFEAGNGGWTSGFTTAVRSTWALGTPNKTTIRGAASGTKAYVTGGLGSGTYSANEKSFLLSPCFNFAGMTNPEISMKLWWNSESDFDGAQLQYSTNFGTTWVSLGAVTPGLNQRNNWYNSSITALGSLNTARTTDGWSGRGQFGSGGYVTVTQSLLAVANYSNVQLRLAFAADGFNQFDGIAVDNISIKEKAKPDLEVLSVGNQPKLCGSTAYFRPKVTIQNNSAQVFNDSILTYMNISGPSLNTTLSVRFVNLSLPVNGALSFIFPDSVNIAAAGTYNYTLYLANDTDAVRGNDTISGSFISQPIIRAFPYFESFETDNGFWQANNSVDTFNLGTPNKALVNAAYNGTKAWVTGKLNGNYKNNTKIELVSPCFDFTSLASPYIEFYAFWDSPTSDGATLQSSTDGGTTWASVGVVGANWYNASGVTSLGTAFTGAGNRGWSGSNSNSSLGWKRFSNDVSATLGGRPNVKFRFLFASDKSVTGAGFGFDHFTIKSKPTYDPAITLLKVPSSTCQGTSLDSVKVTVSNASTQAIDTLGVILSVNGTNYDTVSISTRLIAGGTRVLTFRRVLNTGILGVKTLKATVLSRRDDDTTNSYLVNYVNTSRIRSTPDTLRMQNENDFFTYAKSGKQIWRKTRPNFVLNTGTDTTAWVSANVNGSYGPNAASVLETPCYSIANLTKPYIEFDAAWLMDSRSDGVSLEYTTNGGVNWKTVKKSNNQSTNWFVTGGINNSTAFSTNSGWSGKSKSIDDQVRSIDSTYFINIHTQLDTTINWRNVSSIKFRFIMWSDATSSLVNKGFALKNFVVKSSPVKDIEPISLIGPFEGCELGNPKLGVIVRNNLDSLTRRKYSVTIKVNGIVAGTASRDTIRPLRHYDTDTLYLTTRTNLTRDTSYLVSAVISVPGDEHVYNNYIDQIFKNLPVFTGRYKQSWKSSTDSGWSTNVYRGSSSFVLGTPNKASVSGGYNDTTAWTVASLTGGIPVNTVSDLQSPCFDLSFMGAVGGGYINFRMNLETQDGIDGVQLQYKVGNGNWKTLEDRASERSRNWATGPVYSLDNIGLDLRPNLNLGWSNTTGGEYLFYQTRLPDEAIANNVRFRFLFASDASTASASLSIDDFNLVPKPRVDFRVDGLSNVNTFCGVSGSTQVGMKVRNVTPFDSPRYRAILMLNGVRYDSLSNMNSIVANSMDSIIFDLPVDFTQLKSYKIRVFVEQLEDEFHENDTLEQIIWSTRTISTLPYRANFDSSTNGFVPVNLNPIAKTNWEYGSPSLKPAFGAAASGSKVWATNLTGDYTSAANCALITPCLNLNGASRVEMSFKLKYNSENGFDGLVVERSDNEGLSWAQVGTTNNNTGTTPWYNSDAIQAFSPSKGGFTGNVASWTLYKFNFCPNSSGSVRFRFRFRSDAQNNSMGFGIDDFALNVSTPYEVGIIKVVSPTAGGCGVSAATVPVIRIINHGSEILRDIPVRATLVGRAQIYDDIIAGPINPCDTVDVPLTGGSFNMDAIGTYNLRFDISYPGDLNLTNNTISQTTIRYSDTIRRTIFNGFTGGNINTILPGWQIVSGDMEPDFNPAIPYTGNTWTQSSAAENTRFRRTGAIVNLPNGSVQGGDPYAETRSWMITNPINVKPSSEILFSAAKFNIETPAFYTQQGLRGGLDFDDKLSVVLSPDCGVTWITLLELGDQDLADTLRKFRVPVGTYGTTNIRIAFFVTAGTSPSPGCGILPAGQQCTNNLQTDIFLTNISYDPGPAIDVTISRFETPYQTCGLNASSPLSVRIRNRGYLEARDIPLTVRIDNNPPFTTIFPGPIPVLGEAVVTVSTNEFFGEDRSYRARAWVRLNGDSVPTNDTITTYFKRISTPTTSLSFSPNISVTNIPTKYEGWAFATGDNAEKLAGSGWSIGSLRTQALSRAFSNEDKISWFVSPEIHLATNSSLGFDAALRGTVPRFPGSQYVEIRASSDCGRTWPILISTIGGFDLNPTSQPFGYDLSAYGGRALKFGFRCVDGPTAGSPNLVTLFLDNIVFTSDVRQDAAATSIILTDSCFLPNRDIPIILRVTNAGTDPLENVPVSVDVLKYDGTVLQTFTGTTGILDPSTTQTGVFEDVILGSYRIDSVGPIGFRGTVSLPDDRNPGNNTVIKSVYFCNTTLNGVNALAKNDVTLYPNPNDGKFVINFGNQTVNQVNVTAMNALGQIVAIVESNEIAPNTPLFIDLNKVAKGMYTVKITTSNGALYKNVVVK